MSLKLPSYLTVRRCVCFRRVNSQLAPLFWGVKQVTADTLRLEQHADLVGFRMLMDDEALTKVSAEGCSDPRNPKGAIEPFELGEDESVSANHGGLFTRGRYVLDN